jgi:hypothetical protein
LLANALALRHLYRLTPPVRQQAGSYRDASHGTRRQFRRRLGRAGCRTRLWPQIVGAGLLANALALRHLYWLTQPVRQRAGSYRDASYGTLRRFRRRLGRAGCNTRLWPQIVGPDYGRRP